MPPPSWFTLTFTAMLTMFKFANNIGNRQVQIVECFHGRLPIEGVYVSVSVSALCYKAWNSNFDRDQILGCPSSSTFKFLSRYKCY